MHSSDEYLMDSEQQSIVDRSINADETAVSRLTEISSLAGVSKVVGLRDLHQANQETPTSIVTASDGTVYPELSSNVINCGMSLLTTDLREEDLTSEFVSAFCGELSAAAERYAPDREDAIAMLRRGAEYVTDRWDCDAGTLDHIENGGSMFDNPSDVDVGNIVPPWILHYDGTYDNTPIPSLGSNHFIEFQVVDEVSDGETAAAWGIEEGQVVIFLHGDYTLTSIINWHHANRLKFREQISLADRVKMQVSKAAFHLWRDGPGEFPANWRQYDNRERYTGFDVESANGERLVTAIYGAMNFGYANRLLAFLSIRDAIASLHTDAEPATLLWDVGHDTVQEEIHDGERHWVHRKGAAKAVPGKPAIISGSYNMNSFLGKGSAGAESYVSSYDHGCSNIIEYFEDKETLDEIEHTTRRFSFSDSSFLDEVTHVKPKPIEGLVGSLVDDNVVSRVAWLRPVANIGK
jgi:tRNA-splicing ligase RtcB